MPEQQRENRRKGVSIVFLIPIVAFAIGASLAAEYFFRPSHETTIQGRVGVLSRSLHEATDIISQIEKEINDRMDLVSELEQKARVAEQLHAANRAQVEAISLLLRGELDRKEQWNFWMNVVQNAIFMIIGAFPGYFVERWMSKRRTTTSGAEAA